MQREKSELDEVGSAALSRQYPNACIGNSIIAIAPIVALCAINNLSYLQRIILIRIGYNCSVGFNAEKAGFEMTIFLGVCEQHGRQLLSFTHVDLFTYYTLTRALFFTG